MNGKISTGVTRNTYQTHFFIKTIVFPTSFGATNHPPLRAPFPLQQKNGSFWNYSVVCLQTHNSVANLVTFRSNESLLLVDKKKPNE